MNPETGSKVPRQVRGRNTISSRLSKLMGDLAAYMEQNGESSNEEVDGELEEFL